MNIFAIKFLELILNFHIFIESLKKLCKSILLGKLSFFNLKIYVNSLEQSECNDQTRLKQSKN